MVKYGSCESKSESGDRKVVRRDMHATVQNGRGF